MNEINEFNIKAYNNEQALQCLQKIATIGGLDNCCDVKLIENYLYNANNILEVGAGYGRVLEHLIKINLEGKVYAVEACDFFLKF
jgi:hypothetical protein